MQPLVDRIKSKLSSWRGSLLSTMGRVQLVKSIIQGMIVYSFHVYTWPISLLMMIDKWIRNFIWFGEIFSRKICTVAWHKPCSSFEEGGLGLRSLRAINESAMLKLCWEMFSSSSQWPGFLRARFLKNRSPISH